MNAGQIYGWDAIARARFNYEGDGVFDTWRSHADNCLAGQRWSGDCDDLASTALDLLGRDGLPLDRRFMIVCTASGVGHLVGCAVDQNGSFWIVGDTFGPAYDARRMAHRPIKYHRLNEWDAEGRPVWREGAPWA